MLYELTKFHCLNVFTSRDIGQYVYCNYLLTRLWCHKFWNFTYFFNQAVFRHDQKSKIKIWKGETKNIFLIFKRLSVAKNCLRLESTPLKDLRNFILRIISVVIKHGSIQACIFYLFFWKTSFLSFCAFCIFCLFYVKFDVIFKNLCNICIIIVYIVGVRYSVFLFSLIRSNL